MHSFVKLFITAILYLLCPVAAIPQTLGTRMAQLSEGYHALITNIDRYTSQTTRPYTKEILEQMVTVKNQMSEVVGEMGCLHEKEPELLCLVLVIQEKRLEGEIVTAALKWYDFDWESETTAKAGAETREKEGGWVIVEEAEVEDAGP